MQPIFGLLVLAVLAGVGVGAVWLLASAPPAVSALLGTAFGFLVTKLYESFKESRSKLHDKKREIYARLLKPWVKMHTAQVEKNAGVASPTSDQDIIAEFRKELPEATFDAMLYASDNVVRHYSRMRTSSVDSATDPILLVHFTRLVKAMRQDLGQTYTSLSEAEILATFVNMTEDDQKTFQEAVGRARQLPAKKTGT